MNRPSALTFKFWLKAILSAVWLLVASTVWADAEHAGSTQQFLESSSEFCASYAPFSWTVTRQGDTAGRYGTAVPGDKFTFAATGNGTGTWRIVNDESGTSTLAAGGVFPGSLTYTVPVGGTVTGMGFFVDTYAGSGDTISGSCTSTTLYTLSVTKSGAGLGTVTSNPTGINCGSACSGSFSGSVTLTATPATGSTFAGWSGACTGTGTCAVTVDAGTRVTATFNLNPFAGSHHRRHRGRHLDADRNRHHPDHVQCPGHGKIGCGVRYVLGARRGFGRAGHINRREQPTHCDQYP